MSTELGQRLARLSGDQIKALVRRLEGPDARSRAPATMARNAGGEYPLSSAQERMWFLCRLNPESRASNNAAALRARCEAPLDRERLARGIEEMARRHEILRTTFHDVGGRPFQRIHPAMALRFAWQDLRGLAPARREAEALRIAAEEGLQPFDLESGPLFAVRILQLDALEHLLLVTSHHIISDGWSNALFSRELSAIYTALGQGGHGTPAAPEFQYVDHVQWERDWLRSEAYARQLAYWRARLLPEPAPLRLPTDRPYGAAPRHQGALRSMTLPDDLGAALRRFAREERLGLFHVLMGAWLVLLYRYTGQSDLAIGTSTANRDRPESQGAMGLFINTLAIRVRADGGDSVRTFLGQVKATALEALRHQELPFEKLIGELRPQRNLQSHPLFQVMYVHQNVPSLYEVPGMTLELLKVDYGTTKFDLNLWSEEVNGKLILTLYYASALFDAGTIARMLAHYRTVLESMVAAPDAAIGRLRYFQPEAQPAPCAAIAPAPGDSVHRRFEARVPTDGHRLAVEGGGECWTYAELNARANRLARHLLALGAAPGRPVAMLLERGAAAVGTILAALKAGAGYLALDPGYPARRLAELLVDADADIVVSESRHRALIESLDVPIRAVYLDGDAAGIARLDPANLSLPVAADSLAYLMYTSGTSGRPKGVAVEHRQLLSYCDAIWPLMGLSPGDRCATVSSLAADLGNTMIFPALLNGATVVAIDGALATDAVGLAAYCAAAPIQALKIVPSHLRALLSARNGADLIPRRCLVLGGEACPVDLVAQVRALAPDCTLVHHYGPTETTVGVLAYRVPPAPAGTCLPLGFPLAGSRIYLLDHALEPVAPGVEGEIFIGGGNVARGYWKRPALTAERFIASPFVAGDRLYRSGDIGKYRADGAIEFVGRRDHQIKLRGFRIEPGEIEAALAAHPDVAQAVLRPPAAGDATAHLAAFVCLRPGAAAEPDAIKAFLAQRLPPQMVPAAIVVLERMPLTANGKIDHARLVAPAPVAEAPAARPPCDDYEAKLLQIWATLIGGAGIGVHDNFFDVGGHSLLAVQLMARVFDAWGVRLPLASLFTHGSVEQMAALLRERGAQAGPRAPLVAIQPEGTRAPLCFCHPAGGDVLCYQALSRALGPDFPFFGMQASKHAGQPSIAGLARAYADAAFGAFGATPPVLGGWSMGALVAFEMGQTYRRERGRAPLVVILDQPAPGQDADRDMDDGARLLLFAQKAALFAGRDFGLSEAALRGLSEAGRTALFFDLFKTHGIIPATTVVDDFRGFLDTMLLHNRIALAHRPQVYAGKLLVLRAADAMRIGPRGERAPDLGWQQYSEQPVQIVDVPGDHVSMMRPPHVDVLAARLAACLTHTGELDG